MPRSKQPGDKGSPQEETPEDIFVTLTPWMGIAPTVYVPVIWAVLILLSLFLLLIFPGIRNYGTHLTITSSPAGAEVVIDGVRQGATPVEVFVPAGDRMLEVSLPHFPVYRRTLTLTGRLTGSLFFPRRQEEAVVFRGGDHTAIRETMLQEFSSWALGPEPGGQFQHPPVARVGARLMWAAADDAEPDQSPLLPLTRDMLAIAEPWQASELLGALMRAANAEGIVNTGTVHAMVHNFIQLDNDYPGFFRVFQEMLPAEVTDHYRDFVDEWAATRSETLSTELLTRSLALDEQEITQGTVRLVAGIPFVRVPAGTYITGYPLRERGTTGSVVLFSQDFWIQQDEFSERLMARFLQEDFESPLTDAREDSRTGSQFFAFDRGNFSPDSTLPARAVPVSVAESVARWVQEQADTTTLRPGEMIRLPTANEWEYAAFLNDNATFIPGDTSGPSPSGSGPTGALGARNLTGSLWEWTSSWYGRNSNLLPLSISSHRVVMGGSFANSEASHRLRGAQPPDWATPFLGFRLVIVQETR
jgi:formylglycine-generating enzyme required for sulfatase activity